MDAEMMHSKINIREYPLYIYIVNAFFARDDLLCWDKFRTLYRGITIVVQF